MSLMIFDKDGTICRSKSGQKFINSIDDQELIPGVKERIDELKAQGHKIAIASNQGGVAFGIMTWDEAFGIVKHAADLIGADDFIFCPFHPNGTAAVWATESMIRKPNPGMIIALASSFGYWANDIVFIGDRPEDKQAAKNARVDFVWADDFFERRNDG